MTYLPELRSTLIEAAERRQAPAEGRHRRPRPSLGGLAAVFAAASTIAVVVLALALLHHPTQSRSTAHPAKSASARAVAERLLKRIVLPPGAVRTTLHAGVPADLWSPVDPVSAAHRVDVHAIWRVSMPAQQLMNFLESHPPPGTRPGGASESGSSSGPASNGGSDQIDSFTLDFAVPVGLHATIWRELTVQGDALRGGATMLRADAQAGPLIARPASERLPTAVNRVVVDTSPRGARPRQTVVTTPRTIKRLVALLNSLPVQQPASGCTPGQPSPGPRAKFSFYTASSPDPVAVAQWDLGCSFELTIGGRPQPRLALTSLGQLGSRQELQELSALTKLVQRVPAQHGQSTGP